MIQNTSHDQPLIRLLTTQPPYRSLGLPKKYSERAASEYREEFYEFHHRKID